LEKKQKFLLVIVQSDTQSESGVASKENLEIIFGA